MINFKIILKNYYVLYIIYNTMPPKVHYVCDRCNAEFSSKQRLQSHKDRKAACRKADVEVKQDFSTVNIQSLSSDCCLPNNRLYVGLDLDTYESLDLSESELERYFEYDSIRDKTESLNVHNYWILCQNLDVHVVLKPISVDYLLDLYRRIHRLDAGYLNPIQSVKFKQKVDQTELFEPKYDVYNFISSNGDMMNNSDKIDLPKYIFDMLNTCYRLSVLFEIKCYERNLDILESNSRQYNELRTKVRLLLQTPKGRLELKAKIDGHYGDGFYDKTLLKPQKYDYSQENNDRTIQRLVSGDEFSRLGKIRKSELAENVQLMTELLDAKREKEAQYLSALTIEYPDPDERYAYIVRKLQTSHLDFLGDKENYKRFKARFIVSCGLSNKC